MSSEEQAENSVTRLPWPEQFKALAEQSKSPILKAYYESGCVSPETPLSEVPFVALDFETTGLDANQHSIVSIGLVPFTLPPEHKAWLSELSGISTEVVAEAGKARFAEPMLITHRGLSGPAMLQVSSFWAPGTAVTVDWLPQLEDPLQVLIQERNAHPNRGLERWLRQYFSQRLSAALVEQFGWQGHLQQFSNDRLGGVAAVLKGWQFKPSGTEGYRTAEVTLGGVNTDGLSSRNFEVKTVPGLHFIGEVLDVTGQLGGFNFQWAWASGWCTGMAL